MNKRILISLSVIGLVAAIAIGGTIAYFSDTETSGRNVFTAGTIDIEIKDGDNGAIWEGGFEMRDLKPCETAYINFVISNPGDNPVNIWKHIKNVIPSGGISTEPEQEVGGDTINDIDKWILYDLSVKVTCPAAGCGDPKGSGWWQTIYDENVTVAGITSKDVFLGMIPAEGTMKVTQSYHLKPETGNEYQGDEMAFDIEIYAEQLRGELTLNTKSESDNWLIKRDGTYGKLSYGLTGPTFDYEFEGYKLQASTKYCLIYYADPWPGSGGTDIACGTSRGDGGLSLSGSPDLGMDIPKSGDNNYPDGGKIWLVLESDYDKDNDKMQRWNPDDYLFETGLITYDDTDI